MTASIVILVRRDLDQLASCVRSVCDRVSPAVAYEILVLANGCDSEFVNEMRSRLDGATILESAVNLGFSGGCNAAAAVARGENLVFLNDDTIVDFGWLESLLATSRANERAGAVGSKVLFADGRIQEAGSVLFNDGSSLGLGRGQASDSLAYDYVREVDYCSACSLLVKRTTWDAIGGFDEDYFPAYYEDVDLALKIAQIGQSVLYDPNSRVYHREYSSTDETFRGFLFERNKRIFVERWSTELQFFLAPIERDAPAVATAVNLARGYPRRLLVVDDRPPSHDLGSGFGRMYDMLEELRDGHAATTFFSVAPIVERDAELAALGVEVVSGDFESFVARSHVSFDVVIVSRPHNFALVQPALRRHQPQASIVFDVESLFHRRLALQSRYAVTTEEAISLAHESAAMKILEEGIARSADLIVCISEEEHEALRLVAPDVPIALVRPSVRGIVMDSRGPDERSGIVFVAGWLAGPSAPNADAIVWFVSEIMPLIRKRVPELVLSISGANPPERVARLASEHVRILGRVENLGKLYAGSIATVAPLRYGSGVKIKTIESLQYGTPVVATAVGAQGLGLDVQSLAVLQAPDARTFAELVVRLVSDRSYWLQSRGAVEEQVALWGAERRPSWSDLVAGVTRSARPLSAV